MSHWVRVAAAEDCPVGGLLRIRLEDHDVVVANVDGDYYALLDRCSHQDYPLSEGELEGTRLECIYHGAKFDVCSGRAVQLPAIRPVKTFEVEIRNGELYLQTER